MARCEDCGERIERGHCVNCHEEVFIAEQYYELGTYGEVSESFRQTVEDQLSQPSVST